VTQPKLRDGKNVEGFHTSAEKEVKMKFAYLKVTVALTVLGLLASVSAFAASSTLSKARQEAESAGYAFFSNHDEIVERAKKEGKLRVIANIEPASIKEATKAFNAKYPFIELHVNPVQGGDERIILEIQSGRSDWDVVYPRTDAYGQFLPHLWKVDLLGMAGNAVIQIPTAMIDPKNRNVAAFSSRLEVSAYHKNLLPPDQVPKIWEDFLKPELRGRKFAADIQPQEVPYLVPAWGLEKVLDFARKLAAQQPIWVRGGTRTLTTMVAGEIPLFLGLGYNTVRRSQNKDRAGVLQYVALEPSPVSLFGEQAILNTSRSRHAGLLWMEWLASAEAQKLADIYEPHGASHLFRGGSLEQAIRGKKLSLVTWEHHEQVEQWHKKVLEAYGFPKVEKR
jgi:ABC-type Fe3+ transport system substrate-binding protein